MSREPGFVERLRAIATTPAARGLADDCAVLHIGGEHLILTHDAMAAGVHFLPDQDPADVAWKLVATNLSDLAAKGAEPLGVLLGYQLGDNDARFADGLGEALAHYHTPLLGGDTIGGLAGSGPVLGLTAIGRATHVPVPARQGAAPGDGVWLCGPLGGAMAGLEALRSGDRGAASLAYRRPEARLAEGLALAPLVSAMMDVSDGLLLDATRLAEASAVTLALDSAAIPLAVPRARCAEALRWGEDYALLFTAPAGTPLPAFAAPIGQVLARGPAPLLLDGVPPAPPLGYLHSP